MAAVDATDVVLAALAPYDIPSTPWSAAEKAEPAEKVLAALFARAGIDGPGTIALTRDDEGRVVLEVVERAAVAPIAYRLVPVEDDEEGRDDE